MHAFLKVETAEALASTGCVASSGGDPFHLVDCFAGDEPDEGIEVDIMSYCQVEFSGAAR